MDVACRTVGLWTGPCRRGPKQVPLLRESWSYDVLGRRGVDQLGAFAPAQPWFSRVQNLHLVAISTLTLRRCLLVSKNNNFANVKTTCPSWILQLFQQQRKLLSFRHQYVTLRKKIQRSKQRIIYSNDTTPSSRETLSSDAVKNTLETANNGTLSMLTTASCDNKTCDTKGINNLPITKSESEQEASNLG